MNDLISRNALLDAMPKNDELLSFDVRRVICNAPAVDAVPVVHGRWNPSPYTEKRVKCSNCEVSRDIYTQIAWNYCPNCGAMMDATDNNVGHKDGGNQDGE